jgi:hypothetical protein
MDKVHLHFFGKNFGDIYEVWKILKECDDFRVTHQFYNTGEGEGQNTADFLVTSHNDPKKPRCKNICVQHGYGVASRVTYPDKRRFMNDYKKYYGLGLYGDQQANDYTSMGFPKDKVGIIGCPASIPMLEPVVPSERAEWLESLKLDPHKKTVCYIPSWDMGTPRGLFAEWHQDGKEAERIDNFCRILTEDNNQNVIIRCHEQHRYRANWGAVYSKIFKKYGVYFTFLEGHPSVANFIKYSDTFVGDYSNTNTYVYIANKPIVHLKKDPLPRFAKRPGGWPMDARAGYLATTFKELMTYVVDSIHNPDKFEDVRKEVVKKYIKYTGKDCVEPVIKEFKRLTGIDA